MMYIIFKSKVDINANEINMLSYINYVSEINSNVCFIII